MENLYDVLHIQENASKKEIEKAYKTLVKKYHPDIAKNKEKAEEFMKKINAAYDILGDEEKKREYDQKLRETRRVEEEKKVSYSSDMRTNSVHNNINMNNNQYNSTNYNRYNMYNNYNNYDYMNNPDMINRFLNLNANTKKFVLLFILVIFIILSYNLYTTIRNIFHNDSNNYINMFIVQPSSKVSDDIKEEFVDNKEIGKVFINFMDAMKYSQYYKINSYLTEDTQFTNEQIDKIEKNRRLLDRVLNNMQIDIYDAKTSNLNNGIINITVNRVDMDMIFFNISTQMILQLNMNLSEELVIDTFDENINNKINTNQKILFEKENGEWKIKLYNNNIYEIFGYNIKSGIY